MAFETFGDFIAMGTHGPYVWSVYGLSAILLVGVITQTIVAKKNQIKRLQKIAVKEQNTNAPS